MNRLWRRPQRGALLRTILLALVVGAGGWVLGLEPAASAALGIGILAVGLSWIGGGEDDADPPERWADRRPSHPGIRRELDDLARALGGGRVGWSSWQRVRRLAEHRLRDHGLSLDEAAHTQRIAELLGARAATLLLRSAPPRSSSAVGDCLDALERLPPGARPLPASSSETSARRHPNRTIT